ncbi:TetR/AcrR family transcriptional regulator [Mobilitalea sibirica]|uniref:TetR/AcrR family transcriptional regulator n=1 Tax=Mobilitalea sibirica TaxID=1462919 RepID=A0A8J7HD99_9FIRM|nr:TetR/AcrR family transcriptional regulator [Mobilitalea sibirica]MBH1941812.1 TetR/AcrR family transcriptional regulator [Mobilitalea sibirica]
MKLNTDLRLIKGEETYSRILLSAIEIISESGISGITASKLSLVSNVSKSNIFHHFKSTSEIPKAVLDMIIRELMKPIGGPNANSLDDYLNSLGYSIVNISDEYKKIYKSFFSFYHESMFNETYQKILGEYLNASKADMTKQIKRYSSKSLTDQEANTISTLILTTLDGIGLHFLMKGDKNEYLKVWKLQVEFICNSIK